LAFSKGKDTAIPRRGQSQDIGIFASGMPAMRLLPALSCMRAPTKDKAAEKGDYFLVCVSIWNKDRFLSENTSAEGVFCAGAFFVERYSRKNFKP